MSFIIELPYPPSVNHYWGQRVAKMKGRSIVMMYIGTKGKEYRTSVAKHVLEAKLNRSQKPFGSCERLKVLIYVSPPDRRVRDLDNILKATLDSLTHAKVFGDDKQIDDLHVIRQPVVKGGKLNVHIMEI